MIFNDFEKIEYGRRIGFINEDIAGDTYTVLIKCPYKEFGVSIIGKLVYSYQVYTINTSDCQYILLIYQ